MRKVVRQAQVKLVAPCMLKSRQLDNINAQSNKSESEVSYKFHTSSHTVNVFHCK